MPKAKLVGTLAERLSPLWSVDSLQIVKLCVGSKDDAGGESRTINLRPMSLRVRGQYDKIILSDDSRKFCENRLSLILSLITFVGADDLFNLTSDNLVNAYNGMAVSSLVTWYEGGELATDIEGQPCIEYFSVNFKYPVNFAGEKIWVRCPTYLERFEMLRKATSGKGLSMDSLIDMAISFCFMDEGLTQPAFFEDQRAMLLDMDASKLRPALLDVFKGPDTE